MSKLETDQYIKVKLELDELDLTSAESKATYEEIKDYVLKKHDMKVFNLYISQVKKKCGLDVRKNYNLSKKKILSFQTVHLKKKKQLRKPYCI